MPGKEVAIQALDAVLADYKTDPDRVYLTGFSMGGTETWSLGARYPDRRAALLPVASVNTPEWAVQVKDIPIWAFEGSEDKEGDVQVGRLAVDFVRKAGGRPTYTEFKGVGHEPDHAYHNDDLYAWLKKQKRNPLAKTGELDTKGRVNFDGAWRGTWQNSLDRGWGTATVTLEEGADGLLSGTDDDAELKGERTGVDTFTFEEQVGERRYRMVGRVVGNTMYLDYAVTPLKGEKYYGVYVLKREK
jgi:pimeloyl-ACP methyl ester carboxylesterase